MNATSKIEANPNLAIWDAVSRTDPSHTKKVNQRGGFTAISAHYQVMRATEQFGAVGKGWGYVNSQPIFEDGLCIVPVTIWHGNRENYYGPVYGSAEMRDRRGQLDSDAPKKAATDGLTKALSHLGFNADVFLGRFEDNKYVEAMTREFAGGQRQGEGQGKVSPRQPANEPSDYVPQEPIAGEVHSLEYKFPEGPAKNITGMKGLARALWREIEGCGDTDQLNCLLEIPENKALLKQMSELENPSHREIWEGDGKDNPGIAGLINRKETEFAQAIAGILRAG